MKTYKLLIIDDQTEILNVYKSFFTKRGFNVDVAHDGKEGLAKLLTDEFDVSLVDLRMPKMGGIDVIQQAIQKEVKASLIILTGHGDKEDAIKAINLGADGWLEKTGTRIEEVYEKVKEAAQIIPEEKIDELLALTKSTH